MEVVSHMIVRTSPGKRDAAIQAYRKRGTLREYAGLSASFQDALTLAISNCSEDICGVNVHTAWSYECLLAESARAGHSKYQT
ncbi:hypothetical protein Fuma_01185 [Fuerstiella marisgermanici]|uniref:Uncharacterized protein n=1 Tax=Fuerstiella marisgermanici TaxID=1891926 RepID=A0A1P8WC33_9PLAN|nr:hypothetical protein Fuma_01185 [Fuerstiella marisgermanici]